MNNNLESPEQNIREKVLGKIKSGGVRMRPRAYFVFRIILAVFFSLCALSISIFVASFILFSIHESGEQFLLGFGSRGIATFVSLFPWALLFLDILILILLEWILRGFKFGYRVSLLSIFFSVFLASTALGLLFNLTPAHRSLLEMADRAELPVIGSVYEGIHDSHSDYGVFRGTVSSVAGNEIVITHNDLDRDSDERIHTVILPPGSPLFNIGERVYIFGSSSGTTVIEAEDARSLDGLK